MKDIFDDLGKCYVVTPHTGQNNRQADIHYKSIPGNGLGHIDWVRHLWLAPCMPNDITLMFLFVMIIHVLYFVSIKHIMLWSGHWISLDAPTLYNIYSWCLVEWWLSKFTQPNSVRFTDRRQPNKPQLLDQPSMDRGSKVLINNIFIFFYPIQYTSVIR